MFRKILLLTIFLLCLSVVKTYGSWLPRHTSMNELDEMIILTRLENYGHFVGDIVPIEISIFKKDKSLKINTSRLPAVGEKVNDIEFVKVEYKEKGGLVKIKFNVRTFRHPKFFPLINVGIVTIWYTTDKYWSEKDGEHIYRSVGIGPIQYIQTPVDPDLRACDDNDHFELLKTNNLLFYVFIVSFLCGSLLIVLSKINWIMKIVRRKRQKFYFEKKFLKSLLDHGYDHIDSVKLCYKLRDINDKIGKPREDLNNFIDKVLYENYFANYTEIEYYVEFLYGTIK